MRGWAGGVLLSGVLSVTATAASAGRVEHRCGWIENPTPGNWSLRDRSGDWLLSEQGGYAAANGDALPDMSGKGWVATNGSHGYGCGCLDVETGRGRRITRLVSAEPLPLQVCRADRSLPPP